MNEESITVTAKRLEKYIYNIKGVRTRNTLSKVQLESVIALTANVTVARKALESYANEEDTAEKLQSLDLAMERLLAVREDILTASQVDLLDVVDVSHLSALTEYIIARIA